MTTLKPPWYLARLRAEPVATGSSRSGGERQSGCTCLNQDVPGDAVLGDALPGWMVPQQEGRGSGCGDQLLSMLSAQSSNELP